MSIAFNLINSKDNAYNRAFHDALISQKEKKNVWGMIDWVPKDEYSDLPKSVYNSYKQIAMKPAKNPAQMLMKINAQKMINEHTFKGTNNYGGHDKSPRQAANPTSTAFNLITYDLDNQKMDYNFRNGGITYHRLVPSSIFDTFMISNSLGKNYWSMFRR